MTDTPDTSPAALLDCYDAGLLGGENGFPRDWWHDYIRAELGRAHEFYAQQFATEKEAHEKAIADLTRERDEAIGECKKLAEVGHDFACKLVGERVRAERAEAGAAAMRGELEQYCIELIPQAHGTNRRCGICKEVNTHAASCVLSSTAGRDLLERTERMQTALTEADKLFDDILMAGFERWTMERLRVWKAALADNEPTP